MNVFLKKLKIVAYQVLKYFQFRLESKNVFVDLYNQLLYIVDCWGLVTQYIGGMIQTLGLRLAKIFLQFKDKTVKSLSCFIVTKNNLGGGDMAHRFSIGAVWRVTLPVLTIYVSISFILVRRVDSLECRWMQPSPHSYFQAPKKGKIWI